MPTNSLPKAKAKKTGEVVLDNKKVKFKEGTLRSQLKVPKDYKFSKSALEKIKKVETGEKFKFLGNDFKKTPLMAKRVSFGLTLMSR